MRNQFGVRDNSDVDDEVFHVLLHLCFANERDKIDERIVVVVVEDGDVIDRVVFCDEDEGTGVLCGVEGPNVGIFHATQDVQRFELSGEILSGQMRCVFVTDVPVFVDHDDALADEGIHLVLDGFGRMVLPEQVLDMASLDAPERFDEELQVFIERIILHGKCLPFSILRVVFVVVILWLTSLIDHVL